MSAGKSSAKKAPPPDLLATAMDVIAERGWTRFAFAEVAARARCTLVDVRRDFVNRGAILDALSRRLDEGMLDIDRAELADLPSRDRVFELIMRRFDAMAPMRAGLTRLLRDAGRDPELVLMTACRLDRSLTWLQDAAGLRAHGLRARCQRRFLTLVYLQALRVWSSDDSSDLAKTMAALDKQLRRIEGIAGLAERRAPMANAGRTEGSAA